MSYNFRPINRHQAYLFPPSLEDWLEEGHLAWFVVDAVEQMDLSGFYYGYRSDGCGNTSYHPQLMVALLLYAYCHGETSSRQLERLCQTSIDYRAITANQCPDHSTIARFRKKHRTALKQLFMEVLKLCAAAGLGKLGTVALDGTKMKGNASLQANRTRRHLEKEIARMIREADKTDRAEDKRYGKDRRGDELPDDLQKRTQRREKLEAAKARLDYEAELSGNERLARQEERQAREAQAGRPLRGRKPKEPTEDDDPDGGHKINLTDPDSRILKTRTGHVQGFNAQAVCTEDQIIIAAEVVDQANDQGLLHPMIKQAQMNVEDAGYTSQIVNATADAGYGNEMDFSQVPQGSPELYVATQKNYKQYQAQREAPPPRGRIPACWTATQRMARKLLTQAGQAIYRIRGRTIEPVFGQMKEGRGIRQFSCRGQEMCDGEWSLMCATNNLLKLYRSGKAQFCR